MKVERVLRLYLNRDWPVQEEACPWALLGRDLRVLERGRGNASQWPEADSCEAVITADQVSWLSISLPKKMGRDASRIIAYALEDKLIQPPEAMHFVLPDSAGSAIAVSKARLSEIVDRLRVVGRNLDRLYVDMQLTTCNDDEWAVCQYGESAFLRMGTQCGLAIDKPGTAPPDALVLAVARMQGKLPARLVVRLETGISSSSGGWAAALGIPVVVERPFDPLVASTAGATNLLSGSFSSPGGTTMARPALRLSAILLVLLAVAHTVLSIADWVWLAYRASGLRDQSIAIYRQTFPESKGPLLDPSLQFHREVDAALRQRGMAGRGDMLTMLGVISGELPEGTQPRRMLFDRSVLELVVGLTESDASRISSSMHLRGYAFDAVVLKRDATGTEYRIRLSLK